MKTYLRALILSVFLMCLSITAICQDQPLADSLKAVYNSGTLRGADLMEVIKTIAHKETDITERIHFANQLIAEAHNNQSAHYEAHGYLSLGGAYTQMGQIERALESLLKAAQIADQSSKPKLLGSIYGQISNVYSINEDIRNSLEYQKLALNIFDNIEDSLSYGFASLNIAYDYFNIGEYDSASKYNSSAALIFAKKAFELGSAYIQGNQALVKWKLGDTDNSILDLKAAISSLELLGDEYAIADYQSKLSRIYFELGNYSEAEKFALSAYDKAVKEGFQESARDASLLLSELYDENKTFEKAYLAHKNYAAIKDSIQSIETTQKMADQRVAYEVGQKQAEVDLLDAQKKAREQLLIGVAVIAFLLLVGAFLIYRSYRIQSRLSRELTEQKGQLEKLNTSKDKLFSILSHDLRGPIAAFSGVSMMIKLAVKQQKIEMLDEIADEVKQSSTKLSAMLENLLTWAVQEQGGFEPRPEKLPIKLLFEEVMGMYQSLASNKKIELITSGDEEVNLLVDKNTTLTIFRNLINNALKFTPEGGQVTLHCQSKSQFALVTVSDTGVGITEDKLSTLFDFQSQKSTFGTRGEKGLGLGLTLVKEFVAINSGDINVTSKEGEGTRFEVNLPQAG